MKKITSILLLLCLSLSGFAQLSNLPSDAGNIQAYKENALNIPFEFPVGVTLPTPLKAELRDGKGATARKIASITPVVTVVANLVTIKLTASQVAQLPPITSYYLKAGTAPNDSAILGGVIYPQIGTGVPTTTPYQVTLPSLGTVKINMIGSAATIAQYVNQSKNIRDSLKINQWTGKYILWCGTSIPWNFAPNSYPEQTARMLGCGVYNTSISGSKIIFNGTSAGMSGTYTQNAPYGQNNSYQATILYYMTLATNPATLVVIDHLANDAPFLPDSLGDINSTRKSLFYGAYNFVISQILATNPACKIVLVTSENKIPYGVASPAHEAGNTAIRELGKKWSCPVLDFANEGGINAYTAVAGRATSDGLHPTQAWTNKLAQIAYRFLLTVN